MHHHSHGSGMSSGPLSTYAGIALRLFLVACTAVFAVLGASVYGLKGNMHQAMVHLIVCYLVHFFVMPVKADVDRFNVWIAAKRKEQQNAAR